MTSRKRRKLELDPKQSRLNFAPVSVKMNTVELREDPALAEIVEVRRRKIEPTADERRTVTPHHKLSQIIPQDYPLLKATIESLQVEHNRTSLGKSVPSPYVTATTTGEHGRRELAIRDGRHTIVVSDRRQRVMRTQSTRFAPETPRNMEIKSGWMAIQGVFVGHLYISNTLGRDVSLRNGDYLRVEQVLYSESKDRFLLCGARFQKIQESSICQMLSRAKEDTHQEVCQVLETHKPGDLDEPPQQLFTTPPEQVQGYCRIIATNAGWMGRLGAFDDFIAWPTIFYRYRFLTVYSSNGNAREGAFMHLTAAEADEKWRVDDAEKKLGWRGQMTQPGGSSFGMRESEIKVVRKEHRLNLRARQKFPEVSRLREKYDIWSTEDGQQPQQAVEETFAGESADAPIVLDSPWPGLAWQMSSDNFPDKGVDIHDLDNSDDIIDPASSQVIQLRQCRATDKTWNDSLRTSQQERILFSNSIQRYSCGDGFCGGGGTGRGMREAGLAVSWAFDFEPLMCASYVKNNPGALVANTSVFDFVNNAAYHRIIDILHLSPPCQYFSPAHTVAGQRDEANSAAQFMVTGMLAATRPRIVTLEQTEGIISRHPHWFAALVEQFTALSFSVRWKVVNMADYGVPQERLRLIILASCPGEPLPEFPTPNHSRHPRATAKRPYHTVSDAIRGIPVPWFHHNPLPLMGVVRSSLRRFDGERELAKTLTCHGGIGNNHPSGQRGYTLRELAALQTFPLHHLFPDEMGATVLKRQIGNAVPPLFAKRLFESIVEHLKKVDGVVG